MKILFFFVKEKMSLYFERREMHCPRKTLHTVINDDEKHRTEKRKSRMRNNKKVKNC